MVLAALHHAPAGTDAVEQERGRMISIEERKEIRKEQGILW